jgi:thiol-disulfide isomerase/thioredoxin
LYKVSSLPSGKKTLLIHFNSTCEHCQYEAQELVKNAERLQSHNILLISDERIAIIQKFYEKYNLAKIPHLQILKSNGIDFKQYFGTSSVPAIFIYSAENKLLKHYKGEAKIEAILKYLD